VSNNIICWNCGKSVASLMLPFTRNDECNACKSDVRVCKMCQYYDSHSHNQCRESIADDVSDKERSNFCGYFKVRSGAYQNEDVDAIKKSRADLDALFGDGDTGVEDELLESSADQSSDSSVDSSQERAKIELEKLFGSDDNK